jgi:hypothetical protein
MGSRRTHHPASILPSPRRELMVLAACCRFEGESYRFVSVRTYRAARTRGSCAVGRRQIV